jgi:uncharacterized membrane protein
MRHLQVHVASERVERVLSIARRCGAPDPCAVEARRADGGEPRSVVFVDLPNDRVGGFLDGVADQVEEARFTLLPVGVLPVQTPLSEVQSRVRDVSRLSTLELVLSSLQSIGSWKGMLLYSAFSGIVGAYGIIFNVSYLLVAAMLINPMGAPAMVSVIGLALGDLRMFGRGGLRFFASLALQAAAAAALGVLYGLDFSTATMEQITGLSAMAALLALVAGAAGAQSQIQSERDSLVSGTAAGFMVAAALAPPAAVLGLSVPLGRWDYAALMAFLLLLQFVAIALGGWMVLLLFGVRPGDPSLQRGSRGARAALAAGVASVLVLAVLWQAGQEPRFRKADLSREAVRIVRQSVDELGAVGLVEASARFTRSDLERHDGEGLVVDLIVERLAGAPDEEALEGRVRALVEARLRAGLTGVVPFVDVTVLPPAR